MKIIEKEKYAIKDFSKKPIYLNKFKLISFKNGILVNIFDDTKLEILNIITNKILLFIDFNDMFPDLEFDEKIDFIILSNKILLSYNKNIFIIDIDNNYKFSLLFVCDSYYISALMKPLNIESSFSFLDFIEGRTEGNLKTYNILENNSLLKELNIKSNGLNYYTYIYSANGEFIICNFNEGIDIFSSNTGNLVKKLIFNTGSNRDHIVNIEMKFTSDNKFLLIPCKYDLEGRIIDNICVSNICYVIDFEKMELEYIFGNKFFKTKYKDEYVYYASGYDVYNIDISNNNKYAFLDTKQGTIIFEIATGETINVDKYFRRYLFDGANNNNVMIIDDKYFIMGEIIE